MIKQISISGLYRFINEYANQDDEDDDLDKIK